MRADLAVRIPAPGSPPRSGRRRTWGSAALATYGAEAKTDPQESRLRNPAGQRGGLFHPDRHLRHVEIVLVDVDPARVLARASGWNGLQRRAAEEGYLDVAGEDVERHEPALALDAVKW